MSILLCSDEFMIVFLKVTVHARDELGHGFATDVHRGHLGAKEDPEVDPGFGKPDRAPTGLGESPARVAGGGARGYDDSFFWIGEEV